MTLVDFVSFPYDPCPDYFVKCDTLSIVKKSLMIYFLAGVQV